jgi:hypothetical protein
MMGKILMTQGVIVVDCAVADVAACYSPVSWFCMMQRKMVLQSAKCLVLYVRFLINQIKQCES